MQARWLGIPALVLSMAGCGQSPEISYPPPAQHPAAVLIENQDKEFLNMGDAASSDYLVRDISDHIEGGSWRWTFDKPELRFRLGKIQHRALNVDFSVAEATIKTTGPVTISILVNGREVGTMRCYKAGPYRFEKAVPSQWLKTEGDTHVALLTTPLWTAPDGKHLGVILTSVGFETN